MATEKQSRVLRVGVVRGGEVTEHLIDERVDVTVGTGSKNTIALPTGPEAFTLFAVEGAGYRLRFQPGITGRLHARGTEVDLETLRAQNLSRADEGAHSVELGDDTRGKLSLGETTLLFQFVDAPAAAPIGPPPAPLEPWKNLDKLFLAVFVISMFVHGVSALVIHNTPIPDSYDLDRVPDRFKAFIVDKSEDTPEEAPPPDDAPGEEELAEADEPEEDLAEDEPPSEDIKERAASKEVQEAVKNTGLMAVIGVRGDGASAGEGLVADILGSGANLAEDLDAALAGVSGVGTATSEDALALKSGLQGGGDGETAGIGDMATGGGGAGKVKTGARKTPTVKGKMSSGRVEVETGTADAGAIARYLKARYKSIAGCYEKELKRNPALKGKIVVRIVIGTTGRVADVSIEKDTVGSAAVATCIRNRIRPWRFPFKPEEETAISAPFIFTAQG